jgi:hypothetical protein
VGKVTAKKIDLTPAVMKKDFIIIPNIQPALSDFKE